MPQVVRLRRRRNIPRVIRFRRVHRNRMMVKRVLGPKIHYFKRTAYYSGYISGSTTADVGGSLIGQLNQVPGWTEFKALFDQYKIMALKIRLSPRANSAEVGTNQGLVKVFTAIDTDGGTAPATIADIIQNETLKITKSNRDVVRYFKPKYAVATSTGTPATGGKVTSGWLDCENSSVNHNSLQFVIQQLPGGAQSWDVCTTYYLAFKNVV